MKNKKHKIVAVSGYFDPVHVGHLNLFEAAKKLGDKLIVIVNNDQQLKLKGKPRLMTDQDRVYIISKLKMVDEAIISIDQDQSVCKTLTQINPDIFANGGDRNIGNVPEVQVCKELNIEMIDNVGGGKIRSSSELLNNCGKEE